MAATDPDRVKFHVKVRAGRKTDRVWRAADGTLMVDVRARPVDGRANAAVIAVIAEVCGVAPSGVTITAGFANPHKVIQVPAGCWDQLRATLSDGNQGGT
ncbi:MAG: DUF167 domain-containing protein [Ferrimicrobium sp.]|jgi:uncharacterized protein YggU (UPF0235/DUF167 family)|nr:DUF167 domain-containing protein [Ferrimicrobium sp.]